MTGEQPKRARGRRLGGRVSGIDGLRALAATGVLVFHTYLWATPGVGGTQIDRLFADCMLGVTLFFTLSGYLLFRPYASAALGGGGRPATGSYLRNRALRILPAYWAVLVISELVLVYVDHRAATHLFSAGTVFGGTRDPAKLVAAALLIQNYSPHTFGLGLPQAWSLAVEAVFYLLLPVMGFVIIAMSRRSRSRNQRIAATLAAPALMLAIGLTGKLVAASLLGGASNQTVEWNAILTRSFLAQADLFAFGMIVAAVHALCEQHAVQLAVGWRRALGAAACVLAVPSLMLGRNALTDDPVNTVAALAAGCLLAVVVLPWGRRTRLGSALEHPALVYGGLVSYSVFLWNPPVLDFLTAHGLLLRRAYGVPINLLVVGSITLALSALTYRFVEAPALRLKRAWRARSAPWASPEEPTSPGAAVAVLEPTR